MKSLINRYYGLSPASKATIWFTICNLVIKGISFITVPLFTRLLPDVEYGKLSIILSFEQLFIILATWEIQNGAYQKGIFKYKDDVNSFTIATQSLINIITISFFAIVYIFRNQIETLTGMNNKILFLLFIYLLVFPSYTCWLIRKRTAYDYKSAVGVTILFSGINVFVPLIAILTIGETAVVKYAFTLIASIVICFYFFIQHCNYKTLLRNRMAVLSQWKFLIAFEAPLVFHSLSYLVLSQADRVMIGGMVGEAQAAYYSVAYSVASTVIIVQNSINQALLPWRYQMLEDKQYKKIMEVTNYLLIGVGIIILFVVLISPEVFKILFTKNYYEAIWSMPPITVGVFFMFLYTIFVNIETYFEETQYVMYVSVACGIINIVLNYFGINVFGYIACGYTTLISYVLFALGHYCFMRVTLNKYIPDVKIFHGKLIILLCVMVVALSVLITFCYPYPIIRFVFLCFIIIIGLILKNRIKMFFFDIRKH